MNELFPHSLESLHGKFQLLRLLFFKQGQSLRHKTRKKTSQNKRPYFLDIVPNGRGGGGGEGIESKL